MKNQIRVNGKPFVYSIKRAKDTTASVWVGPYVIEVNRSGQASDLRAKFGATAGSSSGRLVIPAPMPGLVNRVEVAVGASVQAGDPLIVLEAMKMENVIRAGISGKVTKLNATPGKSVEKGEELAVIQAAPE